jgi:hypothetical protein
MRFPVYAMLIFCPTGIFGQSSIAMPVDTVSNPAVPFDITANERTENYTIHRTTGPNGEIVSSTLTYEGFYNSGPELIRIVTTDCEGAVGEQRIPLAKACEFYTGNALLPTRAPDSLIGSDRYYRWRYTDCHVRNRVMGNSSSAPDYYLNYGEKYALRFQTDVRSKLSPEGRCWLDKTVLLFQVATETLVMTNGAAELNDRDFRRQLFDLHPKVYEATGFFDLPLRDQCIVVSHVDTKDLFSQEGFTQIRQLAKDYLPYLGKKLLRKAID